VLCPSDIFTTTAPGLAAGRAVWPIPLTSDNSKAPVRLNSSDESGSLFPFPGPTVVTYTATDLFGNFATCFFSVFVAGSLSLPSLSS
jgi:hypothetical protein